MSTKMDRRTFLKVMGSAGVATTLVSAPATAWAASTKRSEAGFSLAPPAVKAEELLAAVDPELLLRTYTRMVRSRTWEETIMRVRLAGEDMYGNWYPYIGEEAIANGVVLALNDDDMISMTHRAIGALIAKGGELDKLAAELFGRANGLNKGYGGPLHVIQRDKGILGANGIVGGGWYTAAGAAYGAMARGTGQVAVAFAGDGAANSAYFFSAVRNATHYGVPAIFIIENNMYQSSTYYRDCSPVDDLADYVGGLPLPTAVIDGNDVAVVYATAKAAVDRARAGDGPSVIEAKTYRWYHHSNFAGIEEGRVGAWGLPYRSDFELQQWMGRDPIPRYIAFLTEHGVATADELAAIDQEQQSLVDDAIEFAKSSPVQDPEMGVHNVYSTGTVAATQFFNRQGLA